MKFWHQHIIGVVGMALLLVFLASCRREVQENIQRSLQPVPTAYGNLNDISVIADTSLVASEAGDTLDYYFGAAYPILPQPEPIFDLRYYTPWQLQATPILRELRTYLVLADLEETESPTTEMVMKDIGTERLRRDNLQNGYGTTVGRDKWANGQILVYMYGYGQQALKENIRNNFPSVMQRIYEAESKKMDATIYFKGENRAAMDILEKEMGIRIRIPATYELVMQDTAASVYWLRDERTKSSSNIMLKRVKYEEQEQLSRTGLKALRDSLGQYVTSAQPGSYMKINDVDLPLYVSTTNLNGTYALEAQGIWELENDFMGGPFISYLVYNENKPYLVLLDGFVHAPGKEKRDFIQEIEFILHTAKY